jgi:arsenite/tail-anchored protein-transporting ATPase
VEGNARRARDAGVPRFLASLDLQFVIFGGKGGVGKTTCATAAALRLAARSPQSSFLLVSTDPAHSLADSLADLVPPGNLKVLELNPQEYLLDFKKKHNDKLREIASRGTFLDDEEISRFLDLSLPGLDELMAFLEISAWVEKRVYDCIIVDTAPSGHTLRLLTMPEFLRKWVAMLATLLAKHRCMKWAFARSHERDDLDAFLDELTRSIEQMEAVLQDSARCSFVPVMLAEVMSLRETVAIVREADRLKLPIDDIIVNKLHPESHCPVCREEHYLQACELRDLFLHTSLTRFALWGIPLHAEEVRGRFALQSFWEEARPIREPPPPVPTPRLSPGVKVDAGVPAPPRGTNLLIFAGKGGVGKTTLACATALYLAERSPGREVLLVSVGSAHSLSNCLDMPISSHPERVAPGVTALEIDSEAEFEALKQQYAGDIERFLESVSGNFDLAFDREVLERTLDLSPPGLDEVMGLTRVMALLASGEFDILVLDSAATGHLIRLLELPEIIDQWLKAFFDLFLKYQQIFRLSGFSQELVLMSKNLKKLRRLLNNPAQSALYAVSIPTDMAFEETRDLLTACGRLGTNVPGIFLNLVTPPSDCVLCSPMNRRESVIYGKFKQSFHGEVGVIYRRGEIRGLRWLTKLGEALYECKHAEAGVAHAY